MVIEVRDSTDPFVIIDDSEKQLGKPHRVKPVRWIAKVQGTLVEVKNNRGVGSPPPSKVGRVIGQFSGASRLRLLKYLNKIDYSGIGNSSFITLTYPDVIDIGRYAERGKHRYLLLRKCENRARKKFGAIWRIEWEVRKTGIFAGFLRPHFHIACIGTDGFCTDEIRKVWGRIIGYGHKNLQVDVAIVSGMQGVLKYIAKYVAKIPTLDIPLHRNNEIAFGRHWGVTRKELIPLCPVSVMKILTECEILQLLDFATCEIAGYDVNLENGFSLMGKERADIVEQILESD